MSKVILRKKKTPGQMILDGERSKLRSEVETLFPNVSLRFLMWAATKEPYLFALFKSHLNEPIKAHDMWFKITFTHARKLGISVILQRMKNGEIFYDIIGKKKSKNCHFEDNQKSINGESF